MYTSTPLSLLPFSLQHFLLLPPFLQASPPVFAPLFPLIILQMFNPLSFYHPHLFFPPCFRHFYLHLLPLSPFSIILRCFSFFLSSLLFPSSFSPRFPLIILHCSILFPSIILTSLFPPMLPSLLSPSSASFPPSPSSSVASFSFSPPSPLGPYHSPPSLLLLSPSSLEILQLCPLTVFHPLLPPFLLSSNLCTLFPICKYVYLWYDGAGVNVHNFWYQNKNFGKREIFFCRSHLPYRRRVHLNWELWTRLKTIIREKYLKWDYT